MVQSEQHTIYRLMEGAGQGAQDVEEIDRERMPRVEAQDSQSPRKEHLEIRP